MDNENNTTEGEEVKPTEGETPATPAAE